MTNFSGVKLFEVCFVVLEAVGSGVNIEYLKVRYRNSVVVVSGCGTGV